MKIRNITFLALAAFFGMLFSQCKKDNLEAPTSMLTGHIVYQGQAIGVRTPSVSNGNPTSGVQLEIWQRGYQLFNKIPVYVAQDGSYSAALFDGDYKIVRLKGTGPWVDNTDSIDVKVRGNTIVDVPVEPYYFIKTATAAKSGTNVIATCTLQRVNTTKALEAVRIYVNGSTILDQNNNAASAAVLASAIPDPAQPIALNIAIPAALTAKEYVFVRVGVKTTGVTELAYSQPIKVQLN